MEKEDKIVPIDENLDPAIYKIFNEAYLEFVEKYGDKYSDYIKATLERYTAKGMVKKDELGISDATASATPNGIAYTDAKDLASILKHELWHIYNNDSAKETESSLAYTPERYVDVLSKNGYLRKIYEQRMEEYKENFKDEPIRLKSLLISYEDFVSRYRFEDHEVEKWTEWFSSKTHDKDMADNFQDRGNGFYTKLHSSNSFYDYFLSIAEMTSALIPKEKLLDMYLNSNEHNTGYSYSQMIEEFDLKYQDCLSNEEKEKYKYPYLKIIMDTMEIWNEPNSDNARIALQSCMKTCFSAYLIKLNSIENIDIEQAKNIYEEIKNMQEHMLWNTDISKMQDLDYIQEMEAIQDKYGGLLQQLDLNNSDVKYMLDTIDYKTSNPYQQIEQGNVISQKIITTKNIKRDTTENIGEYTANVGENGIKDNLYATLFTLLGDEKYNLLFQEYEHSNSFNENENIMLQLHKKINEATTDEEIIDVYDSIYSLFEKRMEENLNVNESIEYLFNRYQEQILQLQDNALLDNENKMYLPSLEKIISLYQERVRKFEDIMQEKTETVINQEMAETGKPKEVVGFVRYRILNMMKDNLLSRVEGIEEKRAEQMEDTLTVSTQDLGKETLEEQKDTASKEDVSNNIEQQLIAIRQAKEKNTQTIS